MSRELRLTPLAPLGALVQCSSLANEALAKFTEQVTESGACPPGLWHEPCFQDCLFELLNLQQAIVDAQCRLFKRWGPKKLPEDAKDGT